MKMDLYTTTERKIGHIGDISVEETVIKRTDKTENVVRYSTIFYRRGIKIKVINLPMISNYCLEKVTTEEELKEILCNY